MKLNKKAQLGDKMMFIVFIIIIFIIVGGVALAFNIFYSNELDYRLSDASLLYTSVSRCLDTHNLNEEFFNNFYKNCGIVESVLVKNQFVISIYSPSSSKEYFVLGDKVKCQLQDKNENYPRCISGKMNISYLGKIENVELTIGSNQKTNLGVGA